MSVLSFIRKRRRRTIKWSILGLVIIVSLLLPILVLKE